MFRQVPYYSWTATCDWTYRLRTHSRTPTTVASHATARTIANNITAASAHSYKSVSIKDAAGVSGATDKADKERQ